jgi:hypothetical protein
MLVDHIEGRFVELADHVIQQVLTIGAGGGHGQLHCEVRDLG